MLHSTARSASHKFPWGWIDDPGLENFHQISFAPREEAAKFRETIAALPEGRALIEYPDCGDAFRSALPHENTLVFGNPRLADAVRLSIAEPGAFRRELVAPGPDELLAYYDRIAEKRILSFGGWLDHVPAGTRSRHPACRGVDWSLTVANANDSLKAFQRRAVRAVVEGKRALGPGAWRDRSDSAASKFVDGLFLAFRHALTLRGERGAIAVDYDWDDPVKDNDDDKASRALELALLGDRAALLLASYQHAARRIDEALGPRPAAVFPLRTELSRGRYDDARTPDELSASARAVLRGGGAAR